MSSPDFGVGKIRFHRIVLILSKGKYIVAPVEYNMLTNVNIELMPFSVPASAITPVTFVFTYNMTEV